MGSCTGRDDVVDDGLPPKLDGRAEVVNGGAIEVEGVCKNGAF